MGEGSIAVGRPAFHNEVHPLIVVPHLCVAAAACTGDGVKNRVVLYQQRVRMIWL